MPTTPYTLAAVTAFGLEAVVSRELEAIGAQGITVEDGRVWFRGDAALLCRANLHLRSADRVLVLLGRFEARDFGALFDQTRDLPWQNWMTKDAAFPVLGRSTRSQLHSVPDCQRIVKKAIVEALKSAYGLTWCSETGAEYRVEVAIVNDEAILTLDTSGDGLNKRGYRARGGEAPLRETLAAGLVQLSYWNPDRAFLDPFCGSGTIAIEAAMRARRIAPGLNRRFAAENWPRVPPPLWKEARDEARSLAAPDLRLRLLAGDIDPAAIAQAKHNAATAGVGGDVEFVVRPSGGWSDPGEYGCLITNPPYGERLGSQREVEALYRDLGVFCGRLPTWSTYILTGFPDFERLFGRRADRRRKLYNAKIACTYYQYLGPKPPRELPPVGLNPAAPEVAEPP